MDTYSECDGCQTTWAAVRNGHLECLKYLHKNGCPWDKVPIGSKVKIWWKMIQDTVKTRPFVFFWLEKTTISSYSENGRGRKRDREEFSQFVEINF